MLLNQKEEGANNKDNLKFEGEYKNGDRNGKGKEYYYNEELKFEGEYLNGKKWNGEGYDYNGNIVFEIKNGKGNKKEYNDYNDKLEYKGKYLNGDRNGTGREYYYDGKLKFKGEFLNGKRNRNRKEYYDYKILIMKKKELDII